GVLVAYRCWLGVLGAWLMALRGMPMRGYMHYRGCLYMVDGAWARSGHGCPISLVMWSEGGWWALRALLGVPSVASGVSKVGARDRDEEVGAPAAWVARWLCARESSCEHGWLVGVVLWLDEGLCVSG
ncbi:unnamed protein product, partial [Dovyalis caffra]